MATVAVMLWMVELPMLMLLVVPARAARRWNASTSGSRATAARWRSSRPSASGST